MNTIGKKIKSSRESLDYSKEFLAFRTGISLKNITKIEFGELLPSEGDLLNIAKFLDLDLQDIQAEVDNKLKEDNKSSRSTKFLYIFIGICIFLPGINILLAILFYAFNKHNLVVRLVGKRLILLQMFWSFLSLLLILIYLDVIKTNIHQNDSKGLWLLSLLIGGMIISNLLIIICKTKSLKRDFYPKINRLLAFSTFKTNN
jgi:transcriptional regulator with XRE-family HTH domain